MRRGDRGAALPEYALLIGVVVIACIGVISYLGDTSDAKMDDRSGEIGAPSEENALPTAGGGGGGSSTGSTDGEGGEPAVVHVSSLSPSSSKDGSDWSGRVLISVVDGDGNSVQGATVTGSWSVGGGGTTCTTDTNGACSITSAALRRTPEASAVPSVTFTLGSVSGSGMTYDSAGNSADEVTINKPA